jgi:hypothetical protein
MSLPKIIRSVGSRIVGRAPVVDAGRRASRAARVGHHGHASAEVFATDIDNCRNTRIEVVTAAATVAAVAAATATRQANDQERARKQGSWLDYGSRS